MNNDNKTYNNINQNKDNADIVLNFFKKEMGAELQKITKVYFSLSVLKIMAVIAIYISMIAYITKIAPKEDISNACFMVISFSYILRIQQKHIDYFKNIFSPFDSAMTKKIFLGLSMAAFIASTYLHTHAVMHSEGTGPIEMFFPSVIVIFIAVSRYIDEIRFEYDLKISLLKHMMKNNKKKACASKE